MSLPQNLALGRWLVLAAELPHSARFWLVFRRIGDGTGGLLHAEYVGKLVAEDDESAEALTERVSRFAGGGE